MVEYVDHHQGAELMRQIFSCPAEHLPDGEGWAEENLIMSSHLGTHVDAPWHYGSKTANQRAKTVDEIPLSDLYCDALVLDLTHKMGSCQAITVADLEAALKKIPRRLKPGDAVLINTGHSRYEITDPAFYNYPGMERQSCEWLIDQGVKVGGTDALGWDRPFPVMIKDYLQTQDKSYIWDAHFACRKAEIYIVQQLTNLDQLPPCGFQVAFFPLKLSKASAAPARVVAFLS
jgi:kynurenine formamidase